MANRHSVTDQGDLRKYFAAIPNLVFKLGLNPYELALYAHFKQAAGDDGGVCWKSRATIAKESGMSSGMVTKARQSLEALRPELGGLALITVTEEPSKSGGNPTCAIRITDIWPLNMSKFATSPHDVAPSLHDVEAESPSPHDERRHTVTRAPSPHGLKEKPRKKNSEEDREPARASAKQVKQKTDVPPDSCLDLFPMDKAWLATNAPLVLDAERATLKWFEKQLGQSYRPGRTVDEWRATWRSYMMTYSDNEKSRNGFNANDNRAAKCDPDRPMWMAGQRK